jgi:hypothetical protein
MTVRVPSPLLGYNNNVRHKGRVFHIQTEDSGAKYGHIITHLFMDGGRILKSVKTSYAEYVGNERMTEIVREMMKQQHKAMFIALRDGKFDAMADGGADASQQTHALVVESPLKPPSIPPQGQLATDAPVEPAIEPVAVPVAEPDAAPVAVQAAAALAAPSDHPPPPLDPARKTPPPRDTGRFISTAMPVIAEELPPATLRQPQVPEELTLDIDALERAAAAADAVSPLLRAASDLPPPPANLFREKVQTGKYRVTPPAPLVSPAGPGRAPTPPTSRVPTPPPPGARPGSSPAGAPRRPASPATIGAASGERRYAPTRPAAIFGQARPQQGKSIFGEDLISDKSLDEVILSYLSEDLDEKK